MDELRGDQARWRFDGESVVIHYYSGWRKDHVLSTLGRCEIPVVALAAVDFRPGGGGKRRWSLELRARPRTEPYVAVGGALAEHSQPLRLTGPARTELLAEYYADEIASALQRNAEEASHRVPGGVATQLVPRLPLHIQTDEGTAAFDGATVRLTWSGSEASAKKRREQRRVLPLAEIASVEWVPSDGWEFGYLRVVERAARRDAATKPKHDFSCLLANSGRQGADILLMAATITAYLWAAEERRPAGEVIDAVSTSQLTGGGASGANVDWIYEQIERLGGLHSKGVLTDEEFSAKKAELLGRL